MLSNLALAYVGAGRYEDARSSAEASLRAGNEPSRTHLVLALALGRLGRTGQAVEHLKIAAPELPEARGAQKRMERLRQEER